MSDLLAAHFSFQSAALSLRAQRQQLLASNIANADTPNYKARDIDFRQEMQRAMGQGPAVASTMGLTPTGATATTSASALPTISATHPLHFPLSAMSSNISSNTSGNTSGNTSNAPQALYRIPHQDSIDGNSVELDNERAQFADNALRYEAELSELNAKIKNLSSVLQGQ